MIPPPQARPKDRSEGPRRTANLPFLLMRVPARRPGRYTRFASSFPAAQLSTLVFCACEWIRLEYYTGCSCLRRVPLFVTSWDRSEMACVVPSNTTILWESRIPVPRFMTTQAEIATSLKCENKGKMDHKEEH